MPTKVPKRDAIGAYQRKSKATRRAGQDARCVECGETQLEALNIKRSPITCEQCQRKKRGKTIMDNHHIAGKANSPITTSIPANDHRAVLSAAQYEWPPKTLQ